LVAQLFRRPELRELARVPYFLAVMAYVSNRGDSLEGNRLTLYRMLTQNLIVCLDNEKRVSRFRLPDANGALKRDFLCHLAYMGLVARDPEDYADWLVLSDEQVVEEAKRFCFEQQLPATWARELAEDVRATPLLREVGEGAWVFTQRILQEFLAAAALVKRNDYKSEFCLAYFDPVLAETEVLPMSVALAEQRLGPMLTFIEKLPESLTLINFRSRARAMGYGVKPDHEALKRLTNQLVEFVSRCRVEHSSFLKATFNAFSGFSEEERDYVTASILPLLAQLPHFSDGFLISCGLAGAFSDYFGSIA
jgi:hypothetical protein